VASVIARPDPVFLESRNVTDLIRSEVCHLDAERGRLTYRGYDVVELAERGSFEETAFLLVVGRLPSSAEMRDVRRELAARGKLSTDERRMLAKVPADADELAVLRTAVSALGLAPVPGGALAGFPPAALLLLAKVPVYAAERLRLRGNGAKARGRMTTAAALLIAQRGHAPPELERALDAALVLRADNELNPGTFAVRVAASTGADLVSAVTAGFSTLAGPKHSAHTSSVLQLLESVGEPGHAREAVKALLGAGRKPAGFGHPVYRGEDPRTRVARRVAEEACRAAGRPEWFALARAVEDAVVGESDARANVDYYLTSIYVACGFAAPSFAPLFAVARTPGWIAHALEQGLDPELIRPRATYVGPLEQRYKSTRVRR
jgi:citrate synthase